VERDKETQTPRQQRQVESATDDVATLSPPMHAPVRSREKGGGEGGEVRGGDVRGGDQERDEKESREVGEQDADKACKQAARQVLGAYNPSPYIQGLGLRFSVWDSSLAFSSERGATRNSLETLHTRSASPYLCDDTATRAFGENLCENVRKLVSPCLLLLCKGGVSGCVRSLGVNVAKFV
jgi:hypothetical protein